MNREWIIVETVSMLVDNLVCIYFLNSRFKSKYRSFWPQLGVWTLLVVCGLIATNSAITIYSIIIYSIMFMYLLIFKYGTILQKIFGVLMVCSIEIGTSIIGAGLASSVKSTTIAHTLEYQDTSRLLAMLFIKMMQVVVFYILSKRHENIRDLQKGPVIVLSGVVLVDFIFLFLVRMYVEFTDLQAQQNKLLVWLAIGALLVIVAVFMIYELFIREEMKYVELAMKLQRTKLEANYLKEIDNIYSDMRTWQHDYKNNLNALRILVDNAETRKALEYIDNMYGETYKSTIMLQTGNLALDAIVSSKLCLARSHNIEVTMQAVYPENNFISDNELCALVGNLLDNAIEACIHMEDAAERKFIDFSLLVKKKNLLISVCNSYNNEIQCRGNRYITTKKEPFHGIGISHIDAIVAKHQGHVLRSHENGVFETHIMLPLIPPGAG